MNVFVLIIVIVVGVATACVLVFRLKRQKEMERVVDSMISAKNQEMRQRFLPKKDEMEFVFLVLSQRGAGKLLVSTWQKVAERYPNASRERLWALELQMASMPMFFIGEGEVHLVWTIVRVGRENIAVKVRYLEPSLISSVAVRQAVEETAQRLVIALQKRKCEVSVEAVIKQPDLGSLTVIPIK